MISKISNILVTIIVCFIIVVAGILLLPKLFGFQIYGVLSGSMEPEFKVGSVVFVKQQAPEEVQIGDPITFRIQGNQELVATHRIIDINYEEQTFTTKGDANEFADVEPVPFGSFIGKAAYSVPFLGYMAMFIQTGKGIVTGIGVLLFITLLSLLGDLLKKELPSEVEGENSEKALVSR